MSCQWHNEGLDKVVIGIWCLQWSPSHQLFLSHGWGQIWLDGLCLLFTQRWSVFELNQAILSCLTLPMSHHQYELWLIDVEIGIQSIQPSP